MSKVTVLVFILLSILPQGCDFLNKDNYLRQAVVSVNGKTLYQDEIDGITPKGLAQQDSISFIQSYIDQWIKQTLMYDMAEKNIGSDNKEINAMCDMYKRELIINQYQQMLIAQKLDEINEDSLVAFYEKNKKIFLLQKAVAKGIFIKVLTSAADQNKLSKYLTDINDENLDNILRYCTQNAVYYTFFIDNWEPYSNIIALMPEEIDSTDPALTRGTIVQQSNQYSYYLKITGISLAGTPKPYEMAREEISNMLTNQEKLRFITDFKNELYNNAISDKSIQFHDKEE